MRLVALLLMASGCAEMVPTLAPPGPAHWDQSRTTYNVFTRRTHAVVVNPSNRPVELSCSDMRRKIPPHMEARVLVFPGENCDLQNAITYENQP